MKVAAKIISGLFSPLLMVTYGMIICLYATQLPMTPKEVKAGVTIYTFLVSCIIPATSLFLLYTLKVNKSLSAEERNERYIPFLTACLCYLGLGFILSRINAPQWIVYFLYGSALSAGILLGVNFKWKMSAHATAAGGLAGICFRIVYLNVETSIIGMAWITIITIIAAGMTGSARLYLDRHTLWQVLAGYANGFLCIYLITGIN